MRPIWLDNIPDGWDAVPFGSLFTQRNSKNFGCQRDFVLSVVKDKGVIPYTDKGNIGNKVSEDLTGYKLVDKGDFVLNSMNLYMGSLGVSSYDGVTSTAYIVCKPNDDIVPEYYKYLLQFKGFQEYVGLYGKGIMEIREAVRWTALKSVFVPKPQFETQKEIADFLDKETARIDLLIEKKKKMLELLKTKQIELISHSLNHIEGNKLSISKIVDIPITDGPHETPEFLNDGVIFISAEAIKNGDIDFSRKRGLISESDSIIYSKKYIPKKGDIFMVKSGATTGATAMVGDFTKFNIWSPLAVIRVKEQYSNKFMLYYFRSRWFLDYLSMTWSWGTQQNIGMGALGRMKINLPSKEQQEEIVEYLDSCIPNIFQTREKISESINLIKEYKIALITAAVTGKIDVKTYQKNINKC